MIDEYLNTITNITNYVDGILVVDKHYRVVFMSRYHPGFTALEDKAVIGKTLFEVYRDLDPEESSIVAALQKGAITLNKENLLYPKKGEPFRMIDNTYPVEENGEIIGAVSVAVLPDQKDARVLRVYPEQAEKRKEFFEIADIVGRSPQVQTLRSQVERVSKTMSSVMIYGETGTGKELVAQALHTASDRKKKPFISQNCAAIPETLLESLFFGTTKGAYTGAEDKPGIFEQANGGTIFLDEINSMDLNLQAKLLRVLENKQITRVGGSKPVDINVRILAATNKDPAVCAREGTLRPDLFYRLSGITFNLPPLREREGDIALLTDYFVSYYNKRMHRDIMGVSQDVMQIFQRYDWPGNVRELRNAIEGAFNLCTGKIIGVGDLPYYIVGALGMEEALPQEEASKTFAWKGDLKQTVDAYEKEIILDVISRHDSLSAAAAYMGITRQALNQKLKKYDIKRS